MFIEHAYAASTATCVAQGFLDKIYVAIFWPLVALLTATALLVFLYGGFRYISSADNSSERETGKSHMMYGIIGLFIMVTAYAILSIAANTFNLGVIPRYDANSCSGGGSFEPIP